MRTKRALWWLVAAWTLVGCGTKDIQGVCSVNSDCPSAEYYCSQDNQCLCLSDKACATGEYCNPSGHCQKVSGCRLDQDCGDPANFHCLIGTSGNGQCLCKNDSACQSGEFCNTSGQCQKKAGCMADSDCGDPTNERCYIDPDTKIGACLCKADAACQQGEFCNPKGFCQPVAKCTKNEDCPAGKHCDVPSGECLCDHDSNTGCAANEVCNASGYCQPRPGCYDDKDCAGISNTFCDTESKTCIPVGSCNSDRQCAIDQVCGNHVCTNGCRSNDDCDLDKYCLNGACVAGCQADNSCPFDNFCNNSACQNAYTSQTPYCKACVNTDLNICGARGNSCLIYQYHGDPFDLAYPSQWRQHTSDPSNYCAPDCSGNQRCPEGFECNDIISVKTTDLCPPNTCPQGLPCLMGESDQGYCPCHPTKNPCPANTCIADSCMGGKCFALSMSGISLTCQTDADCKVCSVTMAACGAGDTCPAIQCVPNPGVDYGGCVSARACGLMEGFHCPP